jgi:hypothetical protein
MPIREVMQFWQVMLVLLALGLPLRAQSELGLLPLRPQPRLRDDAQNGLTSGDPDAGTVSSTQTARTPAFSDRALVNIDPEFVFDSDWLCPHCNRSSGSREPISDCGTNRLQIQDSHSNLAEDSKSSSSTVVGSHNQADFDHAVYYRNKLEFAFDAGWLPINIPFVFDIFLGDAYNRTPLNYTLVPLVASLRWHMNDVGGPWIFRGNWDMTFSGSITVITRGPETHYFSYDMGIRRNFVPRRGKIAPYFDGRLGLGRIDAKEPLGVLFSQGQNFTFTMNLGSGVRYNFNPRYSVSAGLHWMHISNLYLSEPAFSNYGINVWGPMFGIDIRLRKPRHASE